MNEYLKAIYEISVANNKFLVALEKRMMLIEASMVCEQPPQPDIQQSEEVSE